MKNQITRFIQKQIEADLFKKKAILIYGARQVGKTTLVKSILGSTSKKSVYYNGDEISVQQKFSHTSSAELKSYIGDAEIVVFDEAQRIPNIGLTIKILVDTFVGIQVIATGSSSFDLAQKTGEPLTGRNYPYTLYPLSELELGHAMDRLTIEQTIEQRLIHGTYPEVMLEENLQEKERILTILKQDYLLKDILAFGAVRGSHTLFKLMQALALQIGQEVSLPELSSLIGIDKATVERYIDILEKAFILFRLRSFSRNIRKEIGKRMKIYFYDLGIRNSLIGNFNPVHLRNDIGGIWENYMLVERMKRNEYLRQNAQLYFWRTYDQQEIDIIEEHGGVLHGYEIKWNKSRYKKPNIFLDTYEGSDVSLINRENYYEFVR